MDTVMSTHCNVLSCVVPYYVCIAVFLCLICASSLPFMCPKWTRLPPLGNFSDLIDWIRNLFSHKSLCMVNSDPLVSKIYYELL